MTKFHELCQARTQIADKNAEIEDAVRGVFEKVRERAKAFWQVPAANVESARELKLSREKNVFGAKILTLLIPTNVNQNTIERSQELNTSGAACKHGAEPVEVHLATKRNPGDRRFVLSANLNTPGGNYEPMTQGPTKEVSVPLEDKVADEFIGELHEAVKRRLGRKAIILGGGDTSSGPSSASRPLANNAALR